MKNLRLKSIVLTTTIVIGIISYLWIQNSYHLDILMTKSMHFENKILGDVMASTDVEFIKQKYTELLEIKQQNQIEKNKIIGTTMKHLAVAVLILVLNLILLFIELYKRKKTTPQQGE